MGKVGIPLGNLTSQLFINIYLHKFDFWIKREVKISKYTDDYYTWEIESENSENDPNKLASVLSLKPYSEEEYRKAIDWENQNIHKLYSLELVKELLRK